MGTVIDAVAVVQPTLTHPGRSAISLEERACRAVLDAASLRSDEIDLLINTGMYRDRHLGEPAFASLLQEDLDMNRGHPPEPGRHGTFSFDVLDGVCGPLTAIRMADVLMRAGTIRRALIVGGDTNPDHAAAFPFAPSGGAVLLSWKPDGGGFTAFEGRSRSSSPTPFASSVVWQERRHHLPLTPTGHNTLVIDQVDDYDRRATEAAAEAAGPFLAARGVHLDREDCLVVAGIEPGSGGADRLAELLGADSCAIALPDRGDHGRSLHSAELLSALAAADQARLLQSTRRVVLVAVGAGFTVSVGIYAPHP